MPYTSADIVNLACQISKVPGYTSMAGGLLNAILQDLAQVNDFMFIRKKFFVDCTQMQPSLGFALPSDHERTLDATYTVNGVPVPVTQIPIEQFDLLYENNSIGSYPQFLCVDVSQNPNTMLVFPTPPLAVGIDIRYLPIMPDIATPETSTEVPWFTGQLYLVTKLAAELMMLTDDTRREAFLAESAKLLSKFLTMADDDRENYVRQVKLDPRYFRNVNGQKSTKNIPL